MYYTVLNTEEEMEAQMLSLKLGMKEMCQMQNTATLLSNFCFVLENRAIFCEKIYNIFKYFIFMLK